MIIDLRSDKYKVVKMVINYMGERQGPRLGPMV